MRAFCMYIDFTLDSLMSFTDIAQWVCRRSRKNSDVQIGRKGGNGIKFNGQVTAKRFWKKKSRK